MAAYKQRAKRSFVSGVAPTRSSCMTGRAPGVRVPHRMQARESMNYVATLLPHGSRFFVDFLRHSLMLHDSTCLCPEPPPPSSVLRSGKPRLEPEARIAPTMSPQPAMPPPRTHTSYYKCHVPGDVAQCCCATTGGRRHAATVASAASRNRELCPRLRPGASLTMLLRNDGRAVACGSNDNGQGDIQGLQPRASVVQVSAGDFRARGSA